MTPRLLKKPEYFFNLRQVPERMKYFFSRPEKEQSISLPWGREILVNTQETIGKSLLHMGVYDLSLTECLWRMATPKSRVLDVGANVGYFSILLSHRVGDSGQVFSFEPHPEIYEKLKHNICTYKNCSSHNFALSHFNGKTKLFIPIDFSKNEGLASLEKSESSREIEVEVRALDDLFINEKIDIIKIDVEGHELSVFEGAKNVLANTSTVFFEDFNGAKSKSIQLLQDQGFKVQRILKAFWGPKLVPIEEGEKHALWEPPNYIAYRDESKVRATLSPRGWECLTKGR